MLQGTSGQMKGQWTLDLQEVGCKNMEWKQVVQQRPVAGSSKEQQNFEIRAKCRIFTSRATISFLRRDLLQLVLSKMFVHETVTSQLAYFLDRGYFPQLRHSEESCEIIDQLFNILHDTMRNAVTHTSCGRKGWEKKNMYAPGRIYTCCENCTGYIRLLRHALFRTIMEHSEMSSGCD